MHEKLNPGISVVVPVYNSAESLPLLIERLLAVLVPLADSIEIILVDDRSRDHSWKVITGLAAGDVRVRGLRMMRNYGQHNALLCGIRAARYATTVTLDDDLQHPPEEIPALLDALTSDVDVVYGVPRQQQHGLMRDLASIASKWAMQSAMGSETARNVCSFRVLRTRLRTAFAAYTSPTVILDVLLTWGTTRFRALPVRHDPRTIGKSNYSFRKLVAHALNMMTGFSDVPLRFASFVGFSFTAFGAAVLIYVVGRYLWMGTSVAGFPFLASIIAIFSGAQLLALGIIGEYLARMHFRMMGRPSYVVDELPSGSGSARSDGGDA